MSRTISLRSLGLFGLHHWPPLCCAGGRAQTSGKNWSPKASLRPGTPSSYVLARQGDSLSVLSTATGRWHAINLFQ